MNSIIQCLSNCCCCYSASWTVSFSACPTVAVVIVLHEQYHSVPVQLLLFEALRQQQQLDRHWMIVFMKHYDNSNSWTGTGWQCSWSTTTTATVGQALDDSVHEALRQQQQLDRHWMTLFMKHYGNSNSWTGTGWHCSWSTTTTATVGQALDDTVHEALRQQQQLDRHWMTLFMKHYDNSNSWTGTGWHCSWSTTTTATVGQALDDTVHEALRQQQQLDRHWMILFMKHYDNSNSWTGTGW